MTHTVVCGDNFMGSWTNEAVDRLESGIFKTIHTGFDPAAANVDPNVIMPIAAL